MFMRWKKGLSTSCDILAVRGSILAFISIRQCLTFVLMKCPLCLFSDQEHQSSCFFFELTQFGFLSERHFGATSRTAIRNSIRCLRTRVITMPYIDTFAANATNICPAPICWTSTFQRSMTHFSLSKPKRSQW